MRARFFQVAAAAAFACSAGAALASDPTEARAATIVGANPFLSDGAAAMMNGDWEAGVRLTQIGLGAAISSADRAIAMSNLCAGYVALKQYERALEECDRSIAIDEENWRTWQNRAAANLGLGRIDASLKDIEHGLQLRPDSEELQKTLAIARERERVERQRLRDMLES